MTKAAHTVLAVSGLLLAWGVAHGEASEQWHHYAKDPGGSRYASLEQITRDNVATLERAWTYRTGDIAPGDAHYAECTPLVVDGVMYLITPFSRLIALDAVTGTELWRFSPDPPLDVSETGAGGLASRGVAYAEANGGGRIFLPVRDGRIYSIDVETHAPDPAFGEDGVINLREGLPEDGRYLFLSSPPAIYRHVLLQPYGIDDTSSRSVAYVPLRAYDTRTGALLWTFDTVPQPGQFGHDTWGDGSWEDRGGCNPWAPISVDPDHGLFFAPMGAPNSDKFGGDRPGDNLFSNSVVALDALTGKRRWHFQTVHHDIWDYDLPALPNVVDLEIAGETVPAVAVVGKTGFVYVLNRLDGTPVFPIEERPVPESTFRREKPSPTQPVPVKPPPFARQRLEPSNLGGFDAESRRDVERRFKRLRSEGIFTPPSRQGSVVLPGQLGGGNWSGAAVSPAGHMYVTANELPYVSRIRRGTGPYGVSPRAEHFRDAEGYPAIAPPWGTLTRLDLAAGTLDWQVPIGAFEELTARGIPPTGQMNFGGATVTEGGVVFIGATMDAKFRAIDAESGETLFETQLEAANYGAPVTYMGRDGRQYVAVFAGGGGKAKTKPGDYVIAFRLP